MQLDNTTIPQSLGLVTIGWGSNSSSSSLRLKLTLTGPLTLPTSPSTFQTYSALIVSNVDSLSIVNSNITDISSSPEQGFSAALAFASLGQDQASSQPLDFQQNPPSISIFNTFISGNTGNVFSSPITFQPLLTGYSNITIDKSSIFDNQAGGDGGAVIMDCNPVGSGSSPEPPIVVTLSRSNFTNNSAIGEGGAISMVNGCSALIQASAFSSNSAEKSGGSISFRPFTASSMTISRSNFSQNTAGSGCSTVGCDPLKTDPSKCGGALLVTNGTSLFITSSTFDSNSNIQGEWGGALCFKRDFGTHPASPGQASLAFNLSTAIIQSSTFINNSAPSLGGAIMDQASDGMVLDSCTFQDNSAGSGGAVYSLWSDHLKLVSSTFKGCSATRGVSGGGAVAVSDLLSTFTVTSSSFVENSCTSKTAQTALGGALYVERQLVANPQLSTNFTLSISGLSSFINNRCHQAGAIFINQVSHSIASGVYFLNNSAYAVGGSGGALYIGGLSDLSLLPQPLVSDITGVSFASNSADSLGGALVINGFWSSTISLSSFAGNSVSNETSSSLANSGGAIFASALGPGALVVERSSFIRNGAFTSGALAVMSGNVSIDECSFEGNEAGSIGGAVSSYQPSSDEVFSVSITSSSFVNNRAGSQGGGESFGGLKSAGRVREVQF